MKVQIKRTHSDAVLPSYAYSGDAGLDIYSCVDAEISAGEKEIVPTGLTIAVPAGHVGFVWDKSGIASKHHIKTMAGVLDSNYRGELKVVLTNLGRATYKIEKGQKIAQLVIQPYIQADIEEVGELDDTERGDAGFGSSGI